MHKIKEQEKKMEEQEKRLITFNLVLDFDYSVLLILLLFLYSCLYMDHVVL